MRLDLGPLDRLAPVKAFEVEAQFDPMALGGEVVEFDGPVSLVGKVERVRSGARVRGRLKAAVFLRCGRCLDRFATTLEPEVDVLLYGPGVDLKPDEEGMPYASQVDLGAAVEEAIVLDLPVRPLCRPDCGGLCPRCGAHRRDGCACESEIDPRMGVLAEWVDARAAQDGLKEEKSDRPR